jgi:hypothetical protein
LRAAAGRKAQVAIGPGAGRCAKDAAGSPARFGADVLAPLPAPPLGAGSAYAPFFSAARRISQAREA